MKFLFTRVKNLYFDSLVKEVSDLKEEVSELTTKIIDVVSNNSKLNSLTTDLTTEKHTLKTTNSALSMQVSSLTIENQNLTTTKSNEITKLQQEIELQNLNWLIRFSPTKKYSQLQVSGDRKRVVVVGSGGNGYRNILGEDPLLPCNVYTWKLRYQGTTWDLYVGVIDESKFKVGDCEMHAHCRSNSGGTIRGCLSGTTTQWNPGELLEISVDLINYTLTNKSVSNSSINLTGTLPRLNSGNYYPYASLYLSNHVLEIVE
ncbi:hypothetical protein GEMRC1_000395 [Eukaryota sp. GEM-RC1]